MKEWTKDMFAVEMSTLRLLRGSHGIKERVRRREQNRCMSEALLGRVTYCFFSLTC